MSRLHTAYRSSSLRTVVTVAVSGIALLVVGILSAVNYFPFSPYDEMAHFDYVVKVTQEGPLPAVGELYSPLTRREVACHGSAGFLDAPRCTNPLQPQEMPFGDINYVLRYSPIYYTIAAVVGEVLHHATGMSLFYGARLTSALLYAAGAALLSWALIRLGARRLVALALPLLVMSVPTFVFQGSTVTPDSMGILCGAAGLFVLTLKTSWRRRLITAVIVAIIIGLVKSSFVPLATLVVLTAAVFPGTPDNETGKARWLSLGWKRILVAIGAAVLPVITSYVWNYWRALSLPAGKSPDGGIGDFLVTNQSLFNLITGSVRTLLAPMTQLNYTNSNVLATTATVTQFIIFGGVVAVALTSRLSAFGRARTMAFAALSALGLSIVFLPTTFYVLNHASGTQPRYTQPVIPMFMAALALIMTKRVEVIVITIVGGGFYLATLGDLIRTAIA